MVLGTGRFYRIEEQPGKYMPDTMSMYKERKGPRWAPRADDKSLPGS